MGERDAKWRLVEAAIAMLLEDPGALLDRGLRQEDVCMRAKISPTTFYRHFTKRSFADAVAERLIPVDNVPIAGIGAELLAWAGTVDPRLAIRRVAIADFHAMLRDPMTVRRQLAVVIGRSRQDSAVGLRRSYQASDEVRADAYRVILESWGAVPRLPFSVNDIAVAFAAAAEGLALRALSDPEAVSDELVGEIALAFFATAISTGSDSEYVHDVAEGIALDIMSSRRDTDIRELPENPRMAVVGAARDEFEQRGYKSASLEKIAARAGVPVSVVKRLFPTKAHIVVTALTQQFNRLAEDVTDDVALRYSEVEIIERHLQRCAKLVSIERSYMYALASMVASDSQTDPAGDVEAKLLLDFPALIVPVIQSAQRKGTFIVDVSAYDIAAVLANSLILRCAARRDEPPEHHAHVVAGLVLRGVTARN